MPSVLGYWDIRGLGQPIRLLLKYVGEDFEDKRYSCGPAPDFNKDSWLSEKFTLGLDFPNLPYYSDGHVKLTQFRAILRYIASKYDLVGSTQDERVRIDLVAEQCADFASGFTRICYNQDFENLAVDYKKDLPAKLKQFDDFLGDRNWFAGAKITWVDFPLYEIINAHTIFDPNCLEPFPKLKAHQKRFEDLPSIKAYMESDQFIKRPINNKIAVFK